jgi:hypothetical protein
MLMAAVEHQFLVARLSILCRANHIINSTTNVQVPYVLVVD